MAHKTLNGRPFSGLTTHFFMRGVDISFKDYGNSLEQKCNSEFLDALFLILSKSLLVFV